MEVFLGIVIIVGVVVGLVSFYKTPRDVGPDFTTEKTSIKTAPAPQEPQVWIPVEKTNVPDNVRIPRHTTKPIKSGAALRPVQTTEVSRTTVVNTDTSLTTDLLLLNIIQQNNDFEPRVKPVRYEPEPVRSEPEPVRYSSPVDDYTSPSRSYDDSSSSYDSSSSDSSSSSSSLD